MKTPEEMARDYIAHIVNNDREEYVATLAYLAGYKAAKPKIGTSDYLQYLYVTYLCTKAKAENKA